MSYIGKTPTVGNFIKLDAITTSSTNSYTLQHNSVNFSPESALHMMVSLNGVIQAPNTSYSVSGSTITFLPSSGTLSSSDSIDFIMVYGNILDVGVATTVADSAITNAKTNFVSTSSSAGLQIKGDGTTDGTLQLNCSQNSHGIKLKSPAHSASASYTLTFPTTDGNADEFLKTDGSGVLSWATAGLSECSFRAYQNSQQTVNSESNTQITFDTEDWDTDNAFASNTFTCPSGKAGKYIVVASIRADGSWSASTQFNAQIFRNGASNTGGYVSSNMGASSGNSSIAVAIVDMAVGDTLKAYLWHNEGGAEGIQTGQGNTYFAGTRITT